MRLVLDTDVLRSGLQSANGASRLLLCGIAEGVFRPIVTTSTLLEYEAVLTRPESLAATQLTHAEVDSFLTDLLHRSEHIVPRWRVRPKVRDPNDEIFVEALLNGRGDAVVTFNQRDYLDADDRLTSQGRAAVPTLAPSEALRRLAWRPTAITPFGFRQS